MWSEAPIPQPRRTWLAGQVLSSEERIASSDQAIGFALRQPIWVRPQPLSKFHKPLEGKYWPTALGTTVRTPLLIGQYC